MSVGVSCLFPSSTVEISYLAQEFFEDFFCFDFPPVCRSRAGLRTTPCITRTSSIDSVRRAMAACPGVDGTSKKSSSSGGASTVSSSSASPAAIARRTDTLLEWLCLHLAEHELPEGFDPRGKMLDVIQPGRKNAEAALTSSTAVEGSGGDSGGTGSSSRPATVRTAATAATTTTAAADYADGDIPAAGGHTSTDDPLVRRLLEYGFGRREVMGALEKTTTMQHTQTAQTQERSVAQQQQQSAAATTAAADEAMLGPLGALAQGLLAEATVEAATGSGGTAEATARRGGGSQTEEEALEATNEEVESLEAIYADAVVVSQNMPKVGGGQGGG